MPSYAVTRPSLFSLKQELRENDRVLGELIMLKKWSYALAEARMPDRIVRFGYRGWTTRTLFLQDSSGTDIASVKSLSWWKRDVVVTIDGADYFWKQKDWWGMRTGWFAPDGREIMEFHMRWWGKISINATTQPTRTEMLLVFFGMYVTKLQEMDAAASM
jgi:hypothetical protein